MRCHLNVIAVIALLCVGSVHAAKPLKVFILAGQSNMQGQAKLSTRPHLAESPETKDLHDTLFKEDGTPRTFEQVRIAAFTGKRGEEPTEKKGPLTAGYGSLLTSDEMCGVEFAFGATLWKELQEPILLIKTSWGGRSLHTDFRPPSAGPVPMDTPKRLQWSEEQKKKTQEAAGSDYRRMVEHVKTVVANPGNYHPAYDKEAGYEIAGFIWLQGWNDMVDTSAYPDRDKPGGYDRYTEVMAHFIRDVRNEFKTPAMPFVIGVMGVGGDPKNMSERYRDNNINFRKAQAATADLPEFKGTVAAVHTAPFFPEKVAELDGIIGQASRQARKEMAELRKTDRKRYSGEAAREWQEKRQMELMKAKITPEEIRFASMARSNGAFHYMGSLKCLSQIGEAFAKAVIGLQMK